MVDFKVPAFQVKVHISIWTILKVAPLPMCWNRLPVETAPSFRGRSFIFGGEGYMPCRSNVYTSDGSSSESCRQDHTPYYILYIIYALFLFLVIHPPSERFKKTLISQTSDLRKIPRPACVPHQSGDPVLKIQVFIATQWHQAIKEYNDLELRKWLEYGYIIPE